MLCGITCGSTAASLENKLINKVTPQMIEDEVVSEYYFSAADGVLAGGIHAFMNGDEGDTLPETLSLITFCVLVLKNGFTVVGKSACVAPENFDDEIGRRVARENAINELWPLLGYELKTKLAGMGGI